MSEVFLDGPLESPVLLLSRELKDLVYRERNKTHPYYGVEGVLFRELEVLFSGLSHLAPSFNCLGTLKKENSDFVHKEINKNVHVNWL